MSTFQNDADETEYDFGPPSGFPIPPEAGYEVEREWLALTYVDGAIVSASLVEALDPCVLAQRLNLERLLLSVDIGPSSAELHQEVRVLTEFGEIDMVWRVESSLRDVKTTVQPSDHMDAVEDAGMHHDILGRRFEPQLPPSEHWVLLLMREAMAQSGAIGELVGQAMERSEAYADAMDLSRIGMTWAGLADAVGMAEAVLSEDDPILVGYRTASIHLAGSLRPSSMASWHERKDAYRDMRQKETSERERYITAA